VRVGVEDAFDLALDLAADEDEAAGGKVVVGRFDEDGVDELRGELGERGEVRKAGYWDGGE
jgi:hypothetical protein